MQSNVIYRWNDALKESFKDSEGKRKQQQNKQAINKSLTIVQKKK